MHVIQKSHHSYHDKASHTTWGWYMRRREPDQQWRIETLGVGDFNLKRVILTDILLTD